MTYADDLAVPGGLALPGERFVGDFETTPIDDAELAGIEESGGGRCQAGVHRGYGCGDFRGSRLGGDEAVFFLLALLGVPLYFVVSLVYTVVRKVR